MTFLKGQGSQAEPVAERFVVVHPLDDHPEEKADTTQLGPMPMTWAVRLSLIALRVYLAVMTLLVLYQVLSLAGLLSLQARL